MLFQRRLSLVLALFSFLTACHSSKLDVQAGKVVQQVSHTHIHIRSLAVPLCSCLTCKWLFLQLTELAAFSDDPFPAVTRILFTDADLEARR